MGGQGCAVVTCRVVLSGSIARERPGAVGCAAGPGRSGMVCRILRRLVEAAGSRRHGAKRGRGADSRRR